MKERLTSRGKTSGRADDNEETIIKRWAPHRLCHVRVDMCGMSRWWRLQLFSAIPPQRSKAR